MKALILLLSLTAASAVFAADTTQESESRELVLPEPIKGQRVPEQKWKFDSTVTQCDAGSAKTVGKSGNCAGNNSFNVNAEDSAFKSSRTYDPSATSNTETYSYELKSGK